MRWVRTGLAAAALMVAACPSAESALMSPGEDCATCHGPGSFPHWTAAGTIYLDPEARPDQGVSGATVHLIDSAGRSLALTTNSAGNFYTAEALEPPLQVAVERLGQRIAMPIPAPSGSCNSCHRQPPRNQAPGRVHAP